MQKYFRFGLHFDKNGECPDAMIYHKLFTIFEAFQIQNWKSNVKSYLNNIDSEQGGFVFQRRAASGANRGGGPGRARARHQRAS